MQQRRGGRNSRRTVVEMCAIGTLASLAGIALGLAIDWFPTEASTQAKDIDRLWDVLVVCSVPIFVGVALVVAYAARLFRQRRGEEDLDGPPIHGNTRLEVVWTVLPAMLLVALCTYAYVVLRDIERAPAQAAGGKELKVDVYGQQFAWTFKYTGLDGKPVNTSQLYLPVGRSVHFDVHSLDVIHDFWVPAFRVKSDAVPGTTTGYRVTPTRVGDYPVVCAELCGLGHAYMRQTAHVQPVATFDAWLAKQSAAGADAASAPGAGEPNAGADAAVQSAAADGAAIFKAGNENGATACGSCHQLAAAGTPAGVGPVLDKVLPGQSAEQIQASIVDPGAIVSKGYPDGVMPPNYKAVLRPAELKAVVDYLVASTKK